jgi:outer membrane protein assembly factor BamB
MLTTVLKILLTLYLLPTFVLAGDFSQWRGPNRDGKYNETNLKQRWSKNGPELLWEVNGLGVGHSSVAIANNRIYVTGVPDTVGVLYVFGMQGNLLWKKSYGLEWTKSYPGTHSIPTVKGNRLYLESGNGKVYCLDSLTGEEIWVVDLFKTFEGENIQWGMAESILINGETIIATPGGKKGNVVALNRFNGETVWTSRGNGESATYCSPIYVKHNGTDLIITMTAKSIIGIDANNGKLYWRSPQYHELNIHANTPLYHDGKIFCVSASDENSGAVLLQLSEDGKSVNEIWRNEKFTNLMGGVILQNGYLYGSRYIEGDWYCLDWQTGEVMHMSKALDGGVILYADELFYCYSEKGEMALVKADSKQFKIISSFRVKKGSGPHWAHPVISAGRLYVRHGDNLMAYDISKK